MRSYPSCATPSPEQSRFRLARNPVVSAFAMVGCWLARGDAPLFGRPLLDH